MLSLSQWDAGDPDGWLALKAGDFAHLRVRLAGYPAGDLTNIEIRAPRLTQHFWVWTKGLALIVPHPQAPQIGDNSQRNCTL